LPGRTTCRRKKTVKIDESKVTSTNKVWKKKEVSKFHKDGNFDFDSEILSQNSNLMNYNQLQLS